MCFISNIKATEEEIQNGILRNINADEKSLLFVRKINYSANEKSIMRDKRYAYLDDNDNNDGLLEEIKKNIEKKLYIQNRSYFEVIFI